MKKCFFNEGVEMLIRLFIMLYLLCRTVGLNAQEQKIEVDSGSQYPGIIAASIPKCGTHLLTKLLGKFGFKEQGVRMSSTVSMDYQNLQGLSGKNYFSTHLRAPLDEADMHRALQHKVIFISRDPRDQVVSFAYFMKRYCDLWIDGNLPINELISKLIVDFSIYYTHHASAINDPVLKDIGSVKNFYDLYKGWRNCLGVYATTFEKLVGAKGGGSDSEQYQEIANIAGYLDLNLDRLEIEMIQADLFGGTNTFRLGQIGGWKKYFTHEDKEIFKQVAGQLLIDLGYEQDLNW